MLLKNRNISSKIKRSKVTDYAALKVRLERHKTGLSPPVKYFTDCSKAALLLWIFYGFFFYLAFAMPLCASISL